MSVWHKNSGAFRAQRISKVFDRRNDEPNAMKWSGWRLGNFRPETEPMLRFQKPYKIGETITDNVLQHGVGAANFEAWHSRTGHYSNWINAASTRRKNLLP